VTTYTTLSDASLSQDKPVTQSIARAWRDNPLAIAEADASAPMIDPSSLENLAFFAYKSASESLSYATQPVTFNTELYDVGGAYDVSTSKFQPNSPGLYLLTARVIMLSGASVSGNFNITLNDSEGYDVSEFTSVTNGHNALLTVLVRFNGSTDYARVGWSNGIGAGSDITIKGGQKYYSHFFGLKVGP
jgi:hypothetical protein